MTSVVSHFAKAFIKIQYTIHMEQVMRYRRSESDIEGYHTLVYMFESNKSLQKFIWIGNSEL